MRRRLVGGPVAGVADLVPVALDYSRPGKPTDNAFIEAFNSPVRRECLSQHYSSTPEEARHLLEGWREEYDNHRPHGSLGDRTPAECRSGGHFVPDRNRLLTLRAKRTRDQGQSIPHLTGRRETLTG